MKDSDVLKDSVVIKNNTVITDCYVIKERDVIKDNDVIIDSNVIKDSVIIGDNDVLCLDHTALTLRQPLPLVPKVKTTQKTGIVWIVSTVSAKWIAESFLQLLVGPKDLK